MRRILIGLAVAVIAIIILLVLAASLLNVNRFRPSIEAELQKKLNRPVTLGVLHLRIFPFSIKADSLTIGQSPAFPSPYSFATAQQVYASASLSSLLGGKPAIKSLTLQDPRIELIRNASGTWNFSDLGNSGKQPAASNTSSQFTLDKLQINNGQVAVTDQHAKTPRTVYNHIDADLSGFAPGKQFDFDLAAHLPGPGKELLSVTGKAGPLQAGNTPVTGHLSIQQVSLAALDAVVHHPLPPNTDALASGDANLTSENDNLACKGNLSLADPTVRGTKLGYPIDAQYDIALNQKTDQVQIRSATVKAASTAVSFAGTLDSGVQPPNLNLKLNTNNASIPDLMHVASLLGGSTNASDQIKGSLSAALTIRGPETAPNIQGALSASTLQAEDLVLNNVRATLNMDNGVARLSPVTATAFGGQANGTITIDTKSAHPLFSIQSKLSGVDTNALLSAVSSVKDTLYGSLAADGNVSFVLDSSANLARTLNGTLGFNVTNGHLKNVNILNELARVGKFLGNTPAQSTSGTVLQHLSGTFNIQNGVANTNNLTAAIPEGSLSGAGSLNLASEAIDMHMTAVLANTVSKNVGGTGIGGFMTTALANNKGELVLPVLVTGTMAHPVFTPDVQSIAKLKFSHLLPTTGDPSKLTSGILGSVLGGALGQQPATQNKQKQNQNPLNSILDQFGKKKH